MNFDDIRTPKHYNEYAHQYSNHHQAKSERLIKQDSLPDNFNRSIGGKKYHTPVSSKLINKDSE